MSTKVLHNFSIKTKLLFIVLLPLIGLLVLASIKISILQDQMHTQTQLVKLMDISVASSNLVHELQKERGASAGFLNSKGKKFGDTLLKQRQLTNQKRKELENILAVIDIKQFGDEYIHQVEKALNDLEKIDSMRKKIDSFSLKLSQAVGYYTSMNGNFLDITKESLFVTQDPDTLRNISAYLYFMQSKERAGIERAIGAGGFSGGWTDALKDKFKGLILIQNTYMDVFLAYATQSQKDEYISLMDAPSIAEVQKMRDIALSKGSITQPSVDPSYWFGTITKKINKLKKMEDILSADVKKLVSIDLKKAEAQRNTHLLIIIILISVVILATIVILKDLISKIKSVVRVIVDLSNGDHKENIEPIERSDEIGALINASVRLKEKVVRSFLQAEMIKQMPTAVLTVDKETLTVDYLNNMTREVLGVVESALPRKVSDIKGNAVDFIGKDDEQKKNLFSIADNLPHQEKITIGDQSFQLRISAITDGDEYIAPMMTLHNVTEQEAMATNFESTVATSIDSLAEAANDLQRTAENMRSIADETSKSTEVVVTSSENANQNVGTVASAMEEMTASSAEITTQINNTKVRSNEMAVTAKDANTQVSELYELVSNIGEVVGSIREIADQTNLLALNATIEAARAGEAGKGFSVVADEVKKLASETSAKTDEIEDRIAQIKTATNASVSAMNTIITSISDIDEAVVVVASAAEEQDATNKEIARSISEAFNSVGKVTSITQEVQKGATETQESADTVLSSSVQMAKMAGDMKEAVEAFLNRIRS